MKCIARRKGEFHMQKSIVFLGMVVATAGVAGACGGVAESPPAGTDVVAATTASDNIQSKDDDGDDSAAALEHRHRGFCRRHPLRCDAGADSATDAGADSSSADTGADVGVDSGPPTLCNPLPHNALVCNDFDHGCIAGIICTATASVSAPDSWMVTVPGLGAPPGQPYHDFGAMTTTNADLTLDFDFQITAFPTGGAPTSYTIAQLSIIPIPPPAHPQPLLYLQISATGSLTLVYGTQILASVPFPTRTNWNHITLAVTAPTVQVFVNGVLQLSAADPYAVTPGMQVDLLMGLLGTQRATAISAYFDNVLLTDP